MLSSEYYDYYFYGYNIQWQQARVKEYCSHNQYETGRFRWKQLLYEDKHKVIFCSVPKAGCTTMKTMFALLQGLFTLNQLQDENMIKHANHLSGVYSLFSSYQLHRLKNYFKYTVVRNPLERIVSAYREKIARKISSQNYQILQKKILQHSGNKNSQFPSFSEFIDYLLHSKLSDAHFMPTTELCDPCQIKYDFYVNFKTMNQDVDSLLSLLNIPQEYYFNNITYASVLMPKSTHYNSSVIIDHFYQLSHDQRMKFFKEWSKELEFYETIYPGDIGTYISKLIQ